MKAVLFNALLALVFYCFCLWQLHRYRKFIPGMTGMTISMCLGMAAGLVGGYLPLLYYPTDLFTYSLLGIFAGGFLGILSGTPLGLVCVLEGFFGGLMSGMMGAMLGDMISPPQREFLFYIFLVLLFCTISLAIYLIVHELFKREIPTKLGVVANPFYPIFLLITLFLMFPHNSFKLGQPTPPPSIVIEAREFAYSPNVIKLAKSEPVKITLINKGIQEHDLEIKSISFSQLQINEHSGHVHHSHNERNFLHIHANPGQQSEVIFTPNSDGTYVWFCTLPGHRESGMTGTLIVKG
ncbi:cupredoxin domain-containing protein [Aneurinibacillus sp. Ricciae_BoGa-3]|uniref:cupredoxin domain-containing protein n=1 Tax=Aneurinibacillus sp. Ricciae_BoGa-3 TaxID=3022697 RepID=UPI002340800A|nr:cupredoxin domain-containing protein [Aneurinibacillus sp. Ricciae_BoGa-3]WCK54840.1 cupredoxin domain-containing protein [Aneurinibacillus sp. Ricciae_BoGa-3]